MSVSHVRRRGFLGLGALALVILAMAAAYFIIDDLSAVDRAYMSQAASETKHYREQTYTREWDTCLLALDELQQECIEKAQTTARNYERAAYDLAAQKTIAWWTKISAAIAIVVVILGMIGIYLIWITFRETQSTAEAARDANRPWLEGKELTRIELHFGSDGAEIRADVRIENHGRSPAMNVVAKVKLIAIASTEDRPDKIVLPIIEAALIEQERKGRPLGITVHPSGQEGSEVDDILSADDIRAAQGKPPVHNNYMLAVGISYRFRNRIGRTIKTYSIGFLEMNVPRPVPYEFDPESSYTVVGNNFALRDCYIGYAW